ncbi:TRAP transporter large permease [Pseudothermotoga thermarum]|uniref:TRAP dicarboxylate transporter, DctM subunit n=1 Tax=Pseudothermotoga thermarum DSM 5069 TaxID=688269 RepID=F7YV12_9THEM|nr:TRAP transporter large permease [Pseudothermotoga thermarum]AEH50296.1 TRAP dicarboxylate transporter, DctM subunit [Pseudothermotoga thermarum DSM 5069]
MAWILFALLFVFLFIGLPVAVAIGLSALFVLLKNGVPIAIVAQRMFAATDSFPLIAVPFFILVGDLLSQGKISERLIELADSVFGFLKGGLSVAAVFSSMFIAAISGSGAATTAAVGTSLIPELKKRGYDTASSAALTAAAGTIGVVIPPSVPMVLYAVVANESVAKLFLNGFLPGVGMGLILIFIALREAHKRNYPKGKAFSLKNIWLTFKKAFFGLLAPIIILGGIFSGFFTPSEAAVVAVDYTLILILFVYRTMKPKELIKLIIRSAMTMSIVMFLIAVAGVFGWVLANWNIPSTIANAILSLSDNRYVIMLLIAVIILIAGVFMETASAILILTPVFLPVVKQCGVNLIHFGIIETVGFAIGMVTPPVAINLYVATSITGLSMEKISKSVVPYLFGLILVFLLVVYLPLFVPGLIM